MPGNCGSAANKSAVKKRSHGSRKTGYCNSAAAAHKSVRRPGRSDDCYCSSASRAALTCRCAADRHHLPTVDDRSSHALSSATAHLSGGSIRLPAADDHSFREVSSALGHWLAGSSWQSLAARVRGRFGFSALPRSAYCFLAAAKNYSPRDHSWTGWNSASPKAAGCAKVRFAASSFLNCLAHCPHDSQNYH